MVSLYLPSYRVLTWPYMKALYEIYVTQNYQKAERFLSKFFSSDRKVNPAAIFESLLFEKRTCCQLNKRKTDTDFPLFSFLLNARRDISVIVNIREVISLFSWSTRYNRSIDVERVVFQGTRLCRRYITICNLVEIFHVKVKRKKRKNIYTYVPIAIFSYFAENFVKILS